MATIFEASLRHASYYEDVLRVCEQQFLRGGESSFQGLARLDMDWANIKLGHSWAEAHRDYDDSAAQLCLGYAECGGELLFIRQPVHERIRWIEIALALAQKLRRIELEGTLLNNLSLCHNALAVPRRAIDSSNQALRLSRQTGNRHEEARALGNLATAHESIGEHRLAVFFYEEALQVALDIGDKRKECLLSSRLGSSLAKSGDIERGVQLVERSLKIAGELYDSYQRCQALLSLATVSLEIGQPARAVSCCEEALRLVHRLGDRRLAGPLMGCLGKAHSVTGNRSLAGRLYNDWLILSKEVEDRNSEAAALYRIAELSAEIAEHGEAIATFRRALGISSATGDRLLEGRILLRIGLSLKQLGNYADAVLHVLEAKSVFDQIGAYDSKEADDWLRTLYATE